MIQGLNVSQSERLLSGIWNHRQYNLKNIENIGTHNQVLYNNKPNNKHQHNFISTAANELSCE